MPYLTMRKNLKLQLSPGLVASYDIQPGNGVGLFWDTKHTHIYFPRTLTVIQGKRVVCIVDSRDLYGNTWGWKLLLQVPIGWKQCHRTHVGMEKLYGFNCHRNAAVLALYGTSSALNLPSTSFICTNLHAHLHYQASGN